MRPFSKYWIITVLVLVASFAAMPATWADACGCKVTSPSASTKFQIAECTLYKALASGCTQISIDAAIVKDGLPKTIALPVAVSITGVTITGPSLPGKTEPAVTITTDGNFAEAALFQLSGGASLDNLTITAPGKTAVQMTGSGNSVDHSVITNSAIGFLLEGQGGGITDSTITGTTTAGARITGTGYTLSNNQFTTNKGAAIQLTSAATRAIFDQNSFAGNAVGIAQNGGNANVPPPAFMRAIHPKGNEGAMTLVAIGLGGGKITVYHADGAASPQGKPMAGVSEIVPFSTGDLFLADIYKVDIGSVSKDADLVMTYTHADIGSSAFSEKFKLSKVDEAPVACLSAPWFVKSVYELNAKGSYQSVWDHDSDGDGFSNAQEDKDRNCGVDADESNPGDKTSFGFKFEIFNPCLSNPAFCFVATLCALNPDMCKNGAWIGDADKDGITDAKDNCPTVASADQTDSDGDGLGDICDPDMDNDGLSNEQEASVNGVTPVNGYPGATIVKLSPKTADSDGDGYCDASGFGPIVTGKPAICKAGAGDNCPTVANPNQTDDDEDGIGNDCDESKWALQGGSVALTDSDHDGFKDFTDGNQLKDNCPAIANPADPATGKQADTDGDGRGDACDSDDDNDGVLDVVENSTRYMIYKNGNGAGDEITWKVLNSSLADSDADKLTDGQDECPIWPGQGAGGASHCLDKYHMVNADDSDSDGIPNVKDTCPSVKNMGIVGVSGKDIACDSDMDGDGVANSAEDGQRTHFWEPDSDHYQKPPNPLTNAPIYDGYCDGAGSAKMRNVMMQVEITCVASDICPAIYNPASAGGPQPDLCHAAAKPADTDQDGVPDAKDNCPVVANADQADMDGDAIGNLCDPDIDGDGLPNDADKCAKFKDPSNACVGANPGGSNPPPGGGFPPPMPPINAAMQGGGSSCALVTDATSAAQLVPTLVMFLAPVLAMTLRRRRNPE